MKMTTRVRAKEKIIVVGIFTKNSERSLDELESLATSAGGIVVDRVVQKKEKLDPAFLVGKGKAIELASLARNLGVHCVVFDEELSSTQQRNLENTLDTKIIDRTRLILDVFAQRARSREGMLQVELAQHN